MKLVKYQLYLTYCPWFLMSATCRDTIIQLQGMMLPVIVFIYHYGLPADNRVTRFPAETGLSRFTTSSSLSTGWDYGKQYWFRVLLTVHLACGLFAVYRPFGLVFINLLRLVRCQSLSAGTFSIIWQIRLYQLHIKQVLFMINALENNDNTFLHFPGRKRYSRKPKDQPGTQSGGPYLI